MANFNTYQTRNLYVAKAKKDAADAVTAAGDIFLGTTATGEAFFSYMNADGNLTRSDLIYPKNVKSLKKTAAADMNIKLKQHTVAIDTTKVSLSDLVAFGVLPACIGDSMLWTYNKFRGIPHLTAAGDLEGGFMYYVIVAVMILYVLNALIRLAYYNVTEELIQEEGGKHREYYEGLPVTNAALIFPLVMLFQYIFAADLTAVYFLVMFIVAVLFITPIKLPKLGLKGTLFMIGIGVVEALFLLFFHGGINIH